MGEFNQEKFNNFIKENNIYGFFDKPITLSSGRQSHFYANWRNIVEDVWLTNQLADFIISFINSKNIMIDTFYGVPDGATKIGIITQFKYAQQNMNFQKGSHILAMGRKNPKEHGTIKDKFFVGMPKGKVVVIEDVTTTGESLIKTIKNLKEAEVEIVAVISLTNRMEKRNDGLSVKEAVEQEGIKFYYMSSSLDILPIINKKLKPNKEIIKQIELEFEKYGVEKLRFSSYPTEISKSSLDYEQY